MCGDRIAVRGAWVAHETQVARRVNIAVLCNSLIMCPGPDLNRHGGFRRRGILSPLCIPVSPPGLGAILYASWGRNELAAPDVDARSRLRNCTATQSVLVRSRWRSRFRTVAFAVTRAMFASMRCLIWRSLLVTCTGRRAGLARLYLRHSGSVQRDGMR